jgi:hypothetical protein
MKWLEKLQAEALRSEEWKALQQSILSRIDAKLAAQGIGLFTDLNETEQRIFMDEVEKELADGSDAYAAFRDSLGGSLDATLVPLSRRPPHGASPTDDAGIHTDPAVYTDLAAAAAVALLRRRPDRFADLRCVGCRGLPPPLRRAVWAERLAHRDARAEYERRLAGEDGGGGGRLAVASRRDADIAAACRAALDGDLAGQVSADHLLAIKVASPPPSDAPIPSHNFGSRARARKGGQCRRGAGRGADPNARASVRGAGGRAKAPVRPRAHGRQAGTRAHGERAPPAPHHHPRHRRSRGGKGGG